MGACGHVCSAPAELWEARSCRGLGAWGGACRIWTWSQTCLGLGPGIITSSLVPLGKPQAVCLSMGGGPQLWGGGQSEAVNIPTQCTVGTPHEMNDREGRGGQVMLFFALEPLITKLGFCPTFLHLLSS